MKLAFYKVKNSLNLERHSFDCEDNGEKILAKLAELPDEECRVYDMSKYGYGKEPGSNAADFEDDYNDEIIDGSDWWCIVIR
jgi:hypothetical protein